PFPKYYTDNGSGFIDLSDLNTQVYDPATGDPATGAGRTPFAGNRIPISRVNPVSLRLLQALPKPNQNLGTIAAPNNNYFVNAPFFKDANTYDGKIDYQITPKDHLSVRYSQQIYSLFQAPSFSNFLGGPGNGGGFAGKGHQNAYSTGLNFDHAFSSTLLTEVRFGVAHYRNTSQPADYGVNDATTVGAPGVNVDQLTSGQLGINIGTFSSGPFIGYSPSMPWIRAEANIDFVNNWTKIIGNHTIRFGVDIRRVRDELLQGQTYSPRGVTTFGQNQTSIPGGKTGPANDMASLLLDVPSGVGRDLFTYFPAFRQWWYFGFLGDKWQFKAQLNYWAPRTGFAYRINDKTVVRGGVGMAYMPYADNTWLYNYPVRANNAYTSCGSGSSYLAAQYTCTGNTYSQPVTFQSGFPAPVPVTVPTSGVYQIDPSNSLLNNQTYIYIPQNYHNPYVYSYNVMLQQALPGNFSLQIGYVGNHGVRIGAANNINLPDRLNCGTNCFPLYQRFQRSAGVTQQFIGFSSNYNSLQTTLARRFTNGLSSSSSYTWGRGLGYVNGDDGGLMFFQDLRRNYARNDYDRTNSFSQSVTYELPLGKGKKWANTGFLAQTIGGWKLSGIVLLYSGIPFHVTANGGTINTSGWTQLANQSGAFKKLKGISTQANNPYWFDTSTFSQPNGCTGTATATPTTVTCPIVNGVSV
ncbi:MAG: TonB-dependent receptor, partial [Terriglobus sp.]